MVEPKGLILLDSLYENDHYRIHVAGFIETAIIAGTPYPAGYAVVNKETQIAEYVSTQLPDAYSAAFHMSVSLTERPWEWVAQKPSQPPSGEVH